MVDFGCWSSPGQWYIVFAGVAGLGVLFAWSHKKTVVGIIAGTVAFVVALLVVFCSGLVFQLSS